MEKQLELGLAITKWQEEVDAETVLLIKCGFPPNEARDIAIRVVQNKRREIYADKSGD